jgi:hypothetical protein
MNAQILVHQSMESHLINRKEQSEQRGRLCQVKEATKSNTLYEFKWNFRKDKIILS